MTDRDEPRSDDATHARHEADHPEWARFRRPDPARGQDAEEGPGPEVGAEPSSEAKDPTADAPAPAFVGERPSPAIAQPPPVSSTGLWPALAWRPTATVDSDLEGRIRRDLGRGRTIVRLTWVAALASLVLGLVAVRQAALLVAIDRRLVTTEEVQAAGGTFDLARAALILVTVVGIALAVRWIRDAVPVFARLQELGVLEGPPAGRRLGGIGVLWRAAGVPADRAGWSDVRVGAGRRLAIAAAASVVIAAVVGVVAALWLGAVRDAEMSRMLRIVSGVDGALWLVSSILVGAAIDAILWREAAAARALGVFIPLVDAPSRTILRLVPPALIFGAGILVTSGRPDPWFVPCPSATIECDGMLVPVDHDAGSAATIWIAYAVHHPAREPLGTLAIAVGGPGASGIEEATAIVDSLDEDLVDRYQLLFFDQRGVGASEGRDCPHAGLAYATTVPSADAARTFASACVAEAGVDPSTLARYSTRQAAEDLESIRDRIGASKIALYGESYGTELAQTYAALHPDRLSSLIIDGPVDLTLTAGQFWSNAARGFAQVLDDTLAACSSDSACRAETANADAAYDELLRGLDHPLAASFADPDGTVRPHVIDKAAFEAAVDVLLYDPAGRMLIQRAAAAASNGDFVPAARLVDGLGSGEGIGVSSFTYHAITCADYRVSPSADPHDIAAVEAAGTATLQGVRTDEVYTSQYPCLFWPYQPADATRPAGLTNLPFPVFVLGATDDPITPIAGAEAIAGRLTDGYLIRTRGGPHVTFLRGDECVQGPVLAWLLRGVRPADRTTECVGSVAAPYIPVPPTKAVGFDDALDVMAALENEVFAEPSYVLWKGGDELRFGCRVGGFVAITPATAQDGIRFAGCEIVPGIPFTGLGQYVFDSGRLTWKVKAPDGELDYSSTDGDRHVVGTWEGRPVDITR